MSVPTNTFNAWHLSYVTQSVAGNDNMQAYSDVSNPTKTSDAEMKRVILGEPNGLVLTTIDGRSVSFIHSLKEFGGTLSRPESKVVCLQGMSNSACPFEVDMESLLAPSKIITPSVEDFAAANSVEEIKLLEPPMTTRSNEASNLLECSSFALPTPWQAKALLEADSMDPFELIHVLKQAASQYDEENENKDNAQSAVTFGLPLIRWLWSVGKGSISETKLVFGLDNPELREYSISRHAQCILPPVPTGGTTGALAGSEETITLLTSTLSNLSDQNARANALKVMELEQARTNEASKKNRHLKWIKHDNLLMLQNASSEDGESSALEITNELKELLDADSVGQAGKIMSWQFSRNGLRNTHINEASLRNIYHGDIFSTVPGSLKGLTAFALSESLPLQASQAEVFTIMHMADSQGKAKSMEDIKASLTQTVKVPTSYTEMMDSVERMAMGLKLYLGPKSMPANSYAKFVRCCADSKSQIIAMSANDPQIFAKVMYAPEAYLQQFFIECSQMESREDVSNNFLDFSSITFNISLGQISSMIELPASFKKVESKTPQVEPSRQKQSVEPRNREGKRQKIENQHLHNDFKLKPNENYQQVFTGQEKAKNRPLFNKKCICPKWHIQGYCFTGCSMEESHVPHSQLTANQISQFKSWMADCRKDSVPTASA